MHIAEIRANKPFVNAIEARRAYLAQQGFELFIRASLDCPASVTAQGARIAELSREAELNPKVLRESLLASPRKIRAIGNAALNAHENSSSLDAPRNKRLLPYGLVKIIIVKSFTQAEHFKGILTDEELRMIYMDLYQKHTQNGQGKDEAGVYADDRIKIDAEFLVESARKRKLST